MSLSFRNMKDLVELPRTSLLSHSFFKRSFTVWGHFFVANFIIDTAVVLACFCFISLLPGSLLQGIKTQ